MKEGATITIEEIKKDIESHLGDQVKIVINGTRNRVEEYNATIKNIYRFVFVVETQGNKNVKSFSYVDVLTKNVCIDFI